jgi:hypothetical protein
MVVIERTGEHRLDISMAGKLDSEGMRKVLDELVQKCEGISQGKMLFDVVDYKLPTLSAITIEFSRLPKMLRLIRRFSKAAVLTDKAWLKTISELEGKLIPGLEIKAFQRDQKTAALQWLDGEVN